MSASTVLVDVEVVVNEPKIMNSTRTTHTNENKWAHVRQKWQLKKLFSLVSSICVGLMCSLYFTPIDFVLSFSFRFDRCVWEVSGGGKKMKNRHPSDKKLAFEMMANGDATEEGSDTNRARQFLRSSCTRRFYLQMSGKIQFISNHSSLSLFRFGFRGVAQVQRSRCATPFTSEPLKIH